ncbi:MAG: thioredoxin family protein [Bacilli bacterium]
MSKKSNGKKEVGILAGVVVVGIAIFVVVQIIMNSAQDGGFSKEVSTIDYEEFHEKINNNENFILIYGAESCSFCQEYKPVVADVLKSGNYDDVAVYYIDIDTLSDENKSALANYLGATSTPTSYMFVNGTIMDTLEGKKDSNDTMNFYDLFKSYISE